jgi:hypothetical protein
LIYFIQGTDGGPVKIGYSANVDDRLRQLEVHYGQPLALLATMPGGPDVEAEIHERFRHLRLKGKSNLGRRIEQFRPAADLMAFIGRPLLVGVNPDAVEILKKRTTLVRMDDELVEKAKKVAALRGISLGEFFFGYLKPIVDREFSKEVKKLSKEEGQEGKG